MSAPYHCTVVSPERPLFQGSAEKLVVLTDVYERLPWRPPLGSVD